MPTTRCHEAILRFLKLGTLFVATGYALASERTDSLSQSEPEACAGESWSILGNYPGARAGRCVTTGPFSVTLTIHPEDHGEINPSPWYGFKVVPKGKPPSGAQGSLTITLAYASDHRHRYWPKISSDGVVWESLPDSDVAVEEESGHARIALSLDRLPLYVSAQPNLQEDWYEAWAKELLSSWPGLERRRIGHSAQHRPIYSIGVDQRAPNLVVLLGRAHPPETTGAQAMQAFMMELAALRRKSCANPESVRTCLFFVDHDLIAVPMLNPDGVALGHWRNNASGVDLNRDWGIFSQAETRVAQSAIDALLDEKRKLRLVLDFHSTGRNVFYIQSEHDVTRPFEFATRWLERASSVAKERGGLASLSHEIAPRELSDQGTAKNHFFRAFGVPSITYETGDDIGLSVIREHAAIYAQAMVEELTADLPIPATGTEQLACKAGEACKEPAIAICRDFFCFMGEANKASLVVLHSQELISGELAQRIAGALRQTLAERAAPGAERPSNYLPVEERMIQLAGLEASNIHLGRSRQDLHGTTRRMLFRQKLLEVFDILIKARSVLAEKARAEAGTVIPAYTHGVPSQPTTMGHMLSAFGSSLERDFARLVAAYDRLNLSSIGAAAGSTSGFAIDSGALAGLLGFHAPVGNSYDANFLSSSDSKIEIANAFEGSAVTLTQLVQNIHDQQRDPWPWIYLAPETTSGSSIMPQKRSPRDLDRLRTLAGKTIAQAQQLVLFAHNVASGMHDYRRAAPTLLLFDNAKNMYRQFIAVIDHLELDPDRALQELRRGFSTSTEIADLLHREVGIPFRTAHSVAARLVEMARTRETLAHDLSDAEIEEVLGDDSGVDASAFAKLIRQALDPVHFIATRRGLGGPQPDEMRRGLASINARIREDQIWLQNANAALAMAHLRLQRRFEALSGSSTASGP